MDYLCPNCASTLVSSGDHLHCGQCQQNYRLQARCPECSQPLDVLKACGATDYFCQNGHGMISKKRVLLIPVAE